MRSFYLNLAALLAFIAVLVVVGLFFTPELHVLAGAMNEYGAAGMAVYVLFTAASVVIAPLASIPLVPIASAAWGVLAAAALSVLGWWLGALAAFVVARHLGRPVLERFISLDTLSRWEGRVPEHAGFFGIVLLRIIMPVEIPSYVLGLSKTLTFKTYAAATLIGIIPFALVLAYMGGALAAGDWFKLTLASGGAVLILFLGYRAWLKRRGREFEDNDN